MLPREPPPQGPLGTDFQYSFVGALGCLLSLAAPWPMGQIAEAMPEDGLLPVFATMVLHILYVGGIVTEACFPNNFIVNIGLSRPIFFGIKIAYVLFASWIFSGYPPFSLYLVGILVGTLALGELGVFLKGRRSDAKGPKSE